MTNNPLCLFFLSSLFSVAAVGKQCPGDTRSTQSATDSGIDDSSSLCVVSSQRQRSPTTAPRASRQLASASQSSRRRRRRSAWTGVRVGAAWSPVVAGPVRRCRSCWSVAASHLLAASVIVAEMRSASIGGAIVLVQLLTTTYVLAGGGKPPTIFHFHCLFGSHRFGGIDASLMAPAGGGV